jgi:hypothetical protein
LLQEELKKLSPKNRAAIDLLLKDTVLNKTNRVVDQAERFQWDPSTGPAVPIRQWVNDRHLLGETAETLFPMLKEDMIELFEGDYYECILCLHPDTAIPLLDGSSATIRELADRWKSNQTPFWVYGIKDGAVVPVLALEPRQTGVDDYFKVTLDDGSSFTGNARHQMIMRGGSKRMIRDMAPGDSIMPFDVKLSERPSDRISGYEQVVSIKPVGRGPVYCMTVPETTNFAITTSYSGKEANPTRRAGVFSSNTGGTRWG